MSTPTTPDIATLDPATRYHVVIDTKTGKQYGKPHATASAARRTRDRMDLIYGAIRYTVKTI